MIQYILFFINLCCVVQYVRSFAHKPTKSLFPYQIEGVQRLVNSKRLLLGDEMGLGKTVQCIFAINQLCNLDSRILIVCPKSLLGVWKNELNAWLDLPLNPQFATPQQVPELHSGSITIINYDLCHKHRPKLNDVTFDVLICDEAHYLKNKDAMRTKAILGDDKYPGVSCHHLWLLTGTPVLNRPSELYPILRAINPSEFGSFKTYAERYCDPKKVKDSRGNYRTDYSGAKNLGELSNRLAPFMLRRYKADVLKQLPPKFRSCKCLLDSGEADLERDRIKSILMERSGYVDEYDDTLILEEFGSQASSLMKYLGRDFNLNDPKMRNEIMGLIATVRRETAMSKVDAAVEILENIILSEKVVVFAHHRDVIQKLVDTFGKRAVCVMGGMNNEERLNAVYGFQTDPNIRMFVGSIRAAGVGLTLTASSRVVFLELDWSPAVMSQAEDRCHRIGAAESIQIEYFVFQNTIDEWIARSLMTKQANIDRILPNNVEIDETVGSYTFDFGIYEGIRLEDVPLSYVNFLIHKGIWSQHPKLRSVLYSRGMISHSPIKGDENGLISNKSNISDSCRVEYTFDFGKHKGILWDDTPLSYRDWVINKAVYENRPKLKNALQNAGLI
jgi:SWI/SNF-related matrix-associated actin-dependent regulator of chromatin subfamily A-like protein 1